MFNRGQQEQHLAIADQAIANAEERIQLSMERLDMLRAKRQSTEQEEKLLVLLLHTMDAMQKHRAQMLERSKD